MNKQLLDRVIRSWRTSTVGVLGSAVGIYLFNALGCRWPDPHEWVMVILPAVVGILTRERA